MNRLNNILGDLKDIKPLPDTVLKLVQVVNDPDSTAAQVVEVIQFDQAATSQILRICNSAGIGLSREIRSLNEAIRYLGMIRVLQLVMAIHTNALLSRDQVGYGLPPGVLWKHSVAVALASSAFARQLGPVNASVAFTAGLLHDIGKTVLNEYVTEEFQNIVTLVQEHGLSFNEAEKQVLGSDHAEIGSMLATAWNIPPSIVTCIRYHHAPWMLESPDSLVDAVYLANTVCLLLGIGLGADGLSYRAAPKVLERYNLAESDLESIGTLVLEELTRVERTFVDRAEISTTSAVSTKQEH